MAWDTFARKRVDMIGRKDHGDEVVAHEFDFSIEKQVWMLCRQKLQMLWPDQHLGYNGLGMALNEPHHQEISPALHLFWSLHFCPSGTPVLLCQRVRSG